MAYIFSSFSLIISLSLILWHPVPCTFLIFNTKSLEYFVAYNLKGTDSSKLCWAFM